MWPISLGKPGRTTIAQEEPKSEEVILPDRYSKRSIFWIYQACLWTRPPNNFILIQYLGDEKVAINFPHGNKRHDNRDHIRTCPSVLNELETQCSTSTTSKVYKSSIANLPPVTHIPVLQPRNSKQVENLRVKYLQSQRISCDALYNLHELAIDMPDFIHEIKTHPDLVCVCGQKVMFQELDRVLYWIHLVLSY